MKRCDHQRISAIHHSNLFRNPVITSIDMPNTLAHIGIQTLASKIIVRNCDIRWIALGCIIPDLPWILQRAVPQLYPAIDPFVLRQYAVIQASLFFSLLFAAAISCLVRNGASIFTLLGFNCLLHLLLDALQKKWANGVHLLAPLSWELTHLNYFWPEHLLIKSLTFCGLTCLLFFGVTQRDKPLLLHVPGRNISLCSAFFLLYLLLPFFFISSPLEHNNHYLATLKNSTSRTGQTIAVDRGYFSKKESTITIFTGEKIHLNGSLPENSGVLSIQGSFTSPEMIQVRQYHQHQSPRDSYSIIGLTLVLLFWCLALLKKTIRIRRS